MCILIIKTSKKTKTVCFLSLYIRDLNLPPIRFVQFVPRFVPRCRLYSFIISMVTTPSKHHRRSQSAANLSTKTRYKVCSNGFAYITTPTTSIFKQLVLASMMWFVSTSLFQFAQTSYYKIVSTSQLVKQACCQQACYNFTKEQACYNLYTICYNLVKRTSCQQDVRFLLEIYRQLNAI